MDEIFKSMLAQGLQILTEGPQQVLICRTADGKLHDTSLMHIREEDHREEEALLNNLSGQTVTHILAILDNTTLDLPSGFFRQGLVARCPDAGNALILLQAGSGQMAIPLSLLP